MYMASRLSRWDPKMTAKPMLAATSRPMMTPLRRPSISATVNSSSGVKINPTSMAANTSGPSNSNQPTVQRSCRKKSANSMAIRNQFSDRRCHNKAAALTKPSHAAEMVVDSAETPGSRRPPTTIIIISGVTPTISRRAIPRASRRLLPTGGSVGRARKDSTTSANSSLIVAACWGGLLFLGACSGVIATYRDRGNRPHNDHFWGLGQARPKPANGL